MAAAVCRLTSVKAARLFLTMTPQAQPALTLSPPFIPTTVTFNNTNLCLTRLSGSGKISGTTGLAKQGAGTLTIANINDYTGPTVISAGVVSVTNLANAGSPSPIGCRQPPPGRRHFELRWSRRCVNRGYSVQASSSIDAQATGSERTGHRRCQQRPYQDWGRHNSPTPGWQQLTFGRGFGQLILCGTAPCPSTVLPGAKPTYLGSLEA